MNFKREILRFRIGYGRGVQGRWGCRLPPIGRFNFRVATRWQRPVRRRVGFKQEGLGWR